MYAAWRDAGSAGPFQNIIFLCKFVLQHKHKAMKSRHIPAFLFIACFLVSACSETGKRYYIGVSQCSDDDWRAKMNREISREAMFHDGVEVEFLLANDDNAKQTADINYFIEKGVDLLIVAPNEADAVTPAVEKAFDAGIPVVLVDRKSSSEKYTAFLGGDNIKIGNDVGEYIAQETGGRCRVIEIAGLKGSSPAADRHDGFVETAASYPGIEIVTTVYSDWTKDNAAAIMDSLILSGTDADIVYAHNDRMATGALESARKHAVDNLLFIGVDALPGEGNGVDRVLEGDMAATFIYPTNGDKAIQVAMDILEGRDFQKETILSAPLVEKGNARVMLLQEEQINDLDRKIVKLDGILDAYFKQYSVQRVALVAVIAIIVLIAAILAVITRAYWQGNRLNTQLRAQAKELEEQRDRMLVLTKQLEEATNAKLTFFTNVSHDFRTPLTLISDPVETLLEEGRLNERQTSLLKLVNKNVKILLRLVNQILDFRTYENGKMGLTLSNVDLKSSVQEWCNNFGSLAKKKHIHFRCECIGDGDWSMDIDAEKIERVFFNLVSNAFKFTPENGSITVTLEHGKSDDGNETALLKVTDNGTGMSAGHIAHVFDMFYKIDVTHSGSGIGLALTKAFVELHGGTLTVESEKGKGSRFTVMLPVRHGLAEVPEEAATPKIEASTVEAELSDLGEPAVRKDNETVVLVIDDNRDVREYVASILSEEYTVIEASDGQSGLKMAMKYVPDAIICDVMMPVMDGFECCRRLKNEMQTSHIPVMMLTACTMDEHRVNGYEQGADSYISKPFSSRLLQVRLKNLIDNRHRLKEFFGDNTNLAKEQVSDMDKDFVTRFRKLIDENLHESDLSVEILGEKMGLGRVQLYRKVKALTNYSPVELLRMARLKRAASILASSDKTVAEVCYEVGFSSPSYFTKCYKEYFGENPTDLHKRR